MTIAIRKMNEGDIEQVQSVARSSWRTTYKGIIPDSIQENFVATAYSSEMLLKRLNETLFLVGEEADRIIGFANFTPLKDERKVELGAIYLYEDYQGKGIGTDLLKAGIQHLNNVKKVYVNVEKKIWLVFIFINLRGLLLKQSMRICLMVIYYKL
ncbi:GNAT family N-acetyltransferase [Metabacillus litoralis]|uniref:GNAT family N-acetyltransferase n=1 Tax=Metabacillus litoralis TaxID=152268 RepID=UPI002FC3557A